MKPKTARIFNFIFVKIVVVHAPNYKKGKSPPTFCHFLDLREYREKKKEGGQAYSQVSRNIKEISRFSGTLFFQISIFINKLRGALMGLLY